MRRAGVVAAAAAGALLTGLAGAETPERTPVGPAAPPATSPSPAPSPRARAGKLKLGPFADPYARLDDATLAELLRFEQHIEVEGKAPQELQAAMEAWWEHFNFQYSVYGRGYNIQTPVHPGAVNILPLIDWIKKKIKEGKDKGSSE